MKIERLNQYEGYIVIKKRNGEKHRVLIDLADADRVRGRAWHISSNGYCRTFEGNRTPGMPEVIGGQPCDHNWMFDHKNHDKADNRRRNLRYVTRTENNLNRRVVSNTKFTGISFDKATCTFRVRDKITGKHRGIASLDRAIIYGLASAMYLSKDWNKAKKFVGVKIDPKKEKLVQGMVYLIMCEAYIELTVA